MPTWAAVGVTTQKTPVRITKTEIVNYFCLNTLYQRGYLIKDIAKKYSECPIMWLYYQGEFTFDSDGC